MKKVVLGIVFIGIFLSGCTSSNSSTQTKETSKTNSTSKDITSWSSGESYSSPFLSDSTKESTSTNQTYGLNEEAFVGTSATEPVYSLKIVKATTKLDNTDDFYTNGKPENTVQVTYEYKNYNYDSPLIVRSQFINGYDSNGLAGETLSIMQGQNEVSKGKAAQSTIYIVMNEPMVDKSEIEIEYINDFSLNFDGSLIYKVPLEH